MTYKSYPIDYEWLRKNGVDPTPEFIEKVQRGARRIDRDMDMACLHPILSPEEEVRECSGATHYFGMFAERCKCGALKYD